MKRSGHSRRRIARAGGFGVLSLVVILISIVFSAGPASAHDVILRLDGTTCEAADGTWTVHWEAVNNQQEPERYMLVRAASVTDGTLTRIVANPTYTGIVDADHPDASEGGGTIFPPSGFGPLHFDTTGIPDSTTSVTLTMTGYWHYPSPDGPVEVTVTESLTVDKPADCIDTRPGHIEIHKSTSGGTAPAGPFVFDIASDGTTVASVTVPANGSALSADLPPGTYTLSERNGAPTSTITPNPVTINPGATVVVTAANTYPEPTAAAAVRAAAATAVKGQPAFTG
jgi:hypothetical protein